MTKKISVLAIAGLMVAVIGAFAVQNAAAQGPIYYGPNGQQLGNHFLPPAPMPGFGQQFPVYVSPNQVSGFNPYTGGWNTRNQQVDNTYFDYGRNGSQGNGSKRWVKRPIYDGFGNITGYSQGYVWNNTVTGKEHGDVVDVTNNGSGGQHETYRGYSTIDPSQVK